ncbi:MAG TPA: ATP-dependent protease, partial [Alcanivorax sp.]|nr:ATP-dependent protease [Alcanivorax sp.]
VNLAPADLPKDGGRFDLPIALGILLASGQLGRVDTGKLEFIGELALSGRLNPVPALLPAALACARTGHTLVVPPDNADEAALAGARTLAPASLA